MKMSNFKDPVMGTFQRLKQREVGSQMLEYVIALSVLGIVMVTAVFALQPKSEDRANRTIEVMEGDNPCSGGGSSNRLTAYPCF